LNKKNIVEKAVEETQNHLKIKASYQKNETISDKWLFLKKEKSIDWDFQFDFIYENGEINKNSIVFRDKIIAENEAKFGILQTAFASIILGGVVYFIYF